MDLQDLQWSCPPAWCVLVLLAVVAVMLPTCRTCVGVAGCSCVVMLPEWNWWSHSVCCLWCSGSTDEAGRTRWMLWGKPKKTGRKKFWFYWLLINPQTSLWEVKRCLVFTKIDTQEYRKSYIAEDGYVCDELQDGEPDANVLSSLHHWAAIFSHKLLSVQTNLHPVINKSEERSERTRCHEDGDETKLNHWGERRGFTEESHRQLNQNYINHYTSQDALSHSSLFSLP